MKNFIFGYGSLISTESRVRTANTGDAIPVRVHGLQRAWNFHNKVRKRNALGVILNGDSVCNGIITEVNEETFADFDVREEGYNRIEIDPKNIEVLKDSLPEGNFWVYVPKESILPTKDSPVEQSYVDVVITGCLEFGEDFAQELINSTLYWDHAWVNDRKNPSYPRYLKNPQLERIDTHLKTFVPEAFDKRIDL
ncbi:gamma-glutamylcyclotransferase [Candidatus Woesearchaeota archaeon]|jgi:hypothetical protein|nr:gamma-glutamylcyclotransferase [Candidatus Woesearchaeota archaeon]MBT5397515.1 gamma-glutamylcyclotransferase [Candidatus Woesearchaeota archaeon]MBT5924946.1 gamma-glutamylcyclotransferase [Candidatus Woesearchaeota archaeon]MBT6367912.1 gamma-glutamylcyclotransferase [Candidatus Woesearchaeota archaeon]MBT7763136.1 gamma-glutamylcyclotransferase [Candidatus Woesearchaeota archaeon]